MRRKRLSIEDRFWAKVNKTETCWLWTGFISRKGYGQMTVPRLEKYVTKETHRVSYELHNGVIPKGLLVCHTCDIRNCVNPAHLFLGTYTDNMQDCIAKGRFSFPPAIVGSKQTQSKLTEETALIIKERLKTPYHGIFTHLAKEFGVDRKIIYNINKGLYWKHI